MHSTTAMALAALTSLGRAIPQPEAEPQWSPYEAPWAAHSPPAMEAPETASASAPGSLPPWAAPWAAAHAASASASASLAPLASASTSVPSSSAPWAAQHSISTPSASIPLVYATSYTNTVWQTSTVSTPDATITESPSSATWPSSWQTSSTSIWLPSPSSWTPTTDLPITTSTSYTDTLYITSYATETHTVDCGSGSMVVPSTTAAPAITTPCDEQATNVTITYTLTPQATTVTTSILHGNASFSYHPSASATETGDGGNTPFIPKHTASANPGDSESGAAAELQVALTGVVFGFSVAVGLLMLLQV